MTAVPPDRLGLRQLLNLLWLGPLAIFLAAIVVFLAITIRESVWGQAFIAEFPGVSQLPPSAPVGFPAWLGWQHFLSSLLLLLIIRTGLQLRRPGRPTHFWTRKNDGPIRTKNPPMRMSLTMWFHLSLDALWVLNGLVFYVLLFATGQWARIVPVSWDVVPNAVSAALQYASLEWPHENGWVNYNALQLLAYFVTVFIAAPLAIATGIRLSSAWPREAKGLNRLYPAVWAKRLHFPVMIYFVLFIVAHVTLVLATGALRNLNHMYAGRDDESWIGFVIFMGSLLAMIAAWLLARPFFLAPVASLTGKVTESRRP